jgi:predicted neuraminidase
MNPKNHVYTKLNKKIKRKLLNLETPHGFSGIKSTEKVTIEYQYLQLHRDSHNVEVCYCIVHRKQVHSCRSEEAFDQKRCEMKAEGRGDGS